MAKPTVVILGAGFGGLSAAHALRREAGDAVDLLLVDRSPTFLMGLRKLWLLDGRSRPGEGTRERSGLAAAGIPFRRGSVDAIDLDGRSVVVDGDAVGYDFLIVALGAQPRPDLVDGGADGNPDLFVAEGAEEAGRRLRDLDRGRVLIAIAGLPYKCPPAPYEAAFLIDDVLRREGRRERVAVDVLSPQPMSLPVAGPAACAAVEGRLARRGIGFRPKTTVERLAPGRAFLAGGGAEDADLLIVVPPHRPPAVVTETGLAGEGGWVGVDPRTLATAAEGVFAVGDVVAMSTGSGMPLPKAGVFAEQQGEVVARNIAATVLGREPDASFGGWGSCYLEVGGGEAAKVEGDFLAQPPEIAVADPSPEHLEAKVAFERERLERWFPTS